MIFTFLIPNNFSCCSPTLGFAQHPIIRSASIGSISGICCPMPI
jgi:hypothetical protein